MAIIRRVTYFALPLVALALLLAPAAPAQADLAGVWNGKIALPNAELQIRVNITAADGGWTGTIDIPQQGATGLPLVNFRVEDGRAKFDLDTGPGGIATFDGALDGDKISGSFGQAGMSFPFTLERAREAAKKELPAGMIPREVLFGNPQRAQPQISPDGTRLAYLAPHEGVLNVWVRTVGKDDDRVITSDKKRGIRGYAWQQDGQHILYVQDRDGDENWHIYQTNLQTRNTRDLTPFEGVQAGIVAHRREFPDLLLAQMNLRDRRLQDIYRINLTNGAVEPYTENPGDVTGWTVDFDLKVRAAQAFSPDGGTIIRVRDSHDAPWREFQKWGPDDSFGGVVGFTPDNKGLRLQSSVGYNTARLVEMDIASGRSRVIAEDPQFDVSGVLVNPKTRQIEAVIFLRARSEYLVLDKSLEPDLAALRAVREGDFFVSSRDREDKTWLVGYTTDDGPVYYYAYDRGTRTATLLFSHRPELEQYRLAKMQPIEFTARDGMKIFGYLTLPADKEPKNLPLVLNVHGGPWARDTWGFDPEAQWLANRGYAVLQINFRGSTGYGKAYVNAGDREWAGKMHTDLLDGVNWAVEQGYVDPKKVCIYGGSYGGYAALVGVTFTPETFACGVSIVGPSNIVTLLKSIPPYWEPIKALFHRRVGHPEEDREFLEARSPLFKADRIRVPLLVAQGANDPRVPQAESDQIVAAARKNNLPVEYLVFPDEGHGFARPENRLKFYAAAEAFLARVLGGRVEPPGENEKWDALKK
jgi:dipeptidyl aminopeptidase/acylaminoacyl peptidase